MRSSAIFLVIALLAVTARAQDTLTFFNGLSSQLDSAQNHISDFANQANDIVSSTSASVASSQEAVVAAVSTSSVMSFGPMTDRLAALEALAADFQRSASVDVPLFIAKVTASASQRIAAEAASRQSVNSNLSAVIANILANSNSAFPSASTSRANIWAQMSNARGSINNAASATLAGYVSMESNRAAMEAAQEQAAFDAVSSTGALAQTQSVSGEASRADAFCAASLLAVASALGRDSTGTNDYQNCTSAQLGAVYYSTANSAPFFCDGTSWETFNFGGFFDSTVLTTRAGQTSLISRAGYRWINCFRASRDGFNSYILKSQCAGKITMLIARSTSGYFFGAWSDVTFENRNMWGSSRYNWLWRFNPGTTTLQQATIPSNWGNAVYDYATYGPTYGGGHDLYFNTGLTGSSSGQSTYVPGTSGGSSSSSGLAAGCSGGGGGGGSSWSFSSSALTGSSSFSVSDLEMYYQV